MHLTARLSFYVTLLFLGIGCAPAPQGNSDTSPAAEAGKPNIVIIYLDDLGYGDVSAYGQQTLLTPNMDALAAGGIRFTNGYAASATCTPSRYALLTGRYPWRNTQAKILPGTAPLIIDTSQLTIPRALRAAGYFTGVVGKWHLGLGSGQVNWNDSISPGPNEVGFDYSYIMAATQDRVPTVYLRDGLVQGLDPADPIEVSYEKNFAGEPTGADNRELLKLRWHPGHNNSIVNGIPRIGYMRGGEAARWSDVDMNDRFLDEAQGFIRNHANEPFFLYYAMQQPHVPRTPHPRFAGTSGLGPRGDAILEADWSIGEIMATLRREGLLENTLVILTSDNGPVLNDGYYDQAVELLGDHRPSGPLRGGKYSLYEAGTRVPFITFWQGTIVPQVSDALISQLDFLPSLMQLARPETATDNEVSDAPSSLDGQNLLPVLLGQDFRGRETLILEATSRTALRKGDWLMIPPYSTTPLLGEVQIETGSAPSFQLYNLRDDVEQRRNLAEDRPEKLAEMRATFETIRGKHYGGGGPLKLE